MNPFIEFLQQYGALSGAVVATAAVLTLAFTFYKAAHNRHVKALLEQLRQKDRDIAEFKRGGQKEFRLVIEQLQEHNDQLQAQVEQAKKDAEQAEAKHAAAETALRGESSTLREQCDRHGQTAESLTGLLEAAREELAVRDRADRSRANLMKKAMRLEGRVWE